MKKTIFITGLVVAAIAVMQAKDPVIAPSYAWKMLPPLGLREPSTIDTTLYNYAQESVPSAVSSAYATTGNLGAAGQNMIFFDREPMGEFFFKDALYAWLPSLSTHKF